MPTLHRTAVLAALLCLPLAVLAGKGRLEITSVPGGAKVLINGEWRGNTSTDPAKPLVLPVREGPYRIEAVIESTEQRDVQEVYVAEDAVQPVRLRLFTVPEMVNIPAGSFLMGSPETEPEREDKEGPQHPVQVPAFEMGKYEVTFAQWDGCVAAGGCTHRPDDYGWGRGNRPVINVSWDDAQQYIQWLNHKTGKVYRLPSESEWEYAARASATTPFSTGDCITTSQANYKGTNDYNGCGADTGVYLQKTEPVGSYPANPWGLHDLHGNVFEWTEDCWNDGYAGAPADGGAWLTGNCGARALRGGSWDDRPWFVRVAYREVFGRDDRYINVGFRLARTIAP